MINALLCGFCVLDKGKKGKKEEIIIVYRVLFICYYKKGSGYPWYNPTLLKSMVNINCSAICLLFGSTHMGHLDP